jgi:hypothetical protein
MYSSSSSTSGASVPAPARKSFTYHTIKEERKPIDEKISNSAQPVRKRRTVAEKIKQLSYLPPITTGSFLS